VCQNDHYIESATPKWGYNTYQAMYTTELHTNHHSFARQRDTWSIPTRESVAFACIFLTSHIFKAFTSTKVQVCVSEISKQKRGTICHTMCLQLAQIEAKLIVDLAVSSTVFRD